jgi:ATP-dependent Lon protease
VNEGPGSGVRILNKPVPAAFRESVAYAEQNLYARAAQLVGDKDPRQHEFSVQLRAFDASKSGAKLGDSIEPIHNAVTVAELAVEKGATALLMPVACRRQLFDLSDDMATNVDIQFYTDGREALLKAIQE